MPKCKIEQTGLSTNILSYIKSSNNKFLKTHTVTHSAINIKIKTQFYRASKQCLCKQHSSQALSVNKLQGDKRKHERHLWAIGHPFRANYSQVAVPMCNVAHKGAVTSSKPRQNAVFRRWLHAILHQTTRPQSIRINTKKHSIRHFPGLEKLPHGSTKITKKTFDRNINTLITSGSTRTHARTHTHPFNGPFSGTTRVSGKPIWILLKQEKVSGSGISWAICKSASRSRQITMPVPHHSSFLQAGCPSCRPTNNVKAMKAV